MSFAVPVTRVRAIEPIANADAIELAVVGDYRSVVRKGRFRVGDIVVYLPEAAVLPEPLLNELGLAGKLAGSAKNRIKAIRLRGCLSQGILYDRVPASATEGDCVAEALGVVKYEPPVPAPMAGEVADVREWSRGVAITCRCSSCSAFTLVSVRPLFVHSNGARTSQVCSECGCSVPKTLAERWHDCPECGYSANRDVNAARNVLLRASLLRPGTGLGAPSVPVAA